MIELVKIFTPLFVVLIMGAAAPTPKPTMPRQPSKPGVFVPNPNPPPLCANPPRTGCKRIASDVEILNLLIEQMKAQNAV